MAEKEQKQKFPTMFHSEHLRIAQDLSDPYEDIFTEYPPYAKDDKGNFINPTSEPKLVKTGRINVQEKIQSYKDDVDIYKILQKMAMQGQLLDSVVLTDEIGVDISNIPDNINDFNAYVGKQYDDLSKLPKELSSLILKDDFNQNEFNEVSKAYYEKISHEQKKDVKEEKKE